MKQPSLNFIKFEISKVLFDRIENLSDSYVINVTKTTKIFNDDKNHFLSEILIDAKDSNGISILTVLGFGEFRISEETTKEIYYNFTEISAPSIIYPYLRAFISNLTLQSGLKPIVIPPMNFAALPQQQLQENKINQ